MMNPPDPKILESAEAFLRSVDELRRPDLRINPLTPEQSIDATGRMRGLTIGNELGLVVLDDANDSKPYCLITRGVASGMVVHFSHDPEPRIRFASLDAFADSLRTAVANGLDIDELPHGPVPALADQDALARHLRSLVEREDDEAETLACLFVPLVDPARVDILDTVAGSDSFYIREATAEHIAAHPSVEHFEIAERLAKDSHSQVARPGKKALSAVNRLRYARPQETTS